MDKRTYITILYDYYGELFNENQQSCFEDYYFQNFSLSEIGDNNKVSRNAVHKTIKSVEEKLYFYEEKLKLYEKSLVLDDIIKKVKDKDITSKLELLR